MEKPAPENARVQLVAAAKKLFSRKGLDGTTVRELADEAGVNVSLVSYHFDGKEGLYRNCLEQFGRASLEAAGRVLQPPVSREELRVRVEMFVDELIRAHFNEPELSAMVLKECDKEFPVIEDIFRRTFLQMFETLTRFFQAAKKAGILGGHVDPFLAAGHLMSLVIHPLRMDLVARKFHRVTLSESVHRDRFKKHVVGTLLDGIAKEKTR